MPKQLYDQGYIVSTERVVSGRGARSPKLDVVQLEGCWSGLLPLFTKLNGAETFTESSVLPVRAPGLDSESPDHRARFPWFDPCARHIICELRG